MKNIAIVALLALAFTTGFTCSKHTPGTDSAAQPAATQAAPAQEQMAAPAAPAEGQAAPAATPAAPADAAAPAPAGH